jgi:enamine deaminase RidA (YjgF/YER057c/UK114 family)
MSITERIQAAGISLEDRPLPGGNYVSVNIRGKVAYVAIQFPIQNGQMMYRGVLGKDLSTQDGYEAARLSAINVLKQVHAYMALDNIEGLNHIDVYYNCELPWDDGPAVANGASDLFTELLGEAGQHTRAIFGVHSLPRGFCVGITASFTLR